MNRSLYKKGVTIAELVVVIGILGLIMIAISTFQVNVIKNNRYAQDSLITLQDGRVIIRTMIKELRSVSPSNNGAFPIIQASTSTISFFSDIDGDGSKEQVRYFIASSTVLKKGIIRPTGTPSVYNSASEVITIIANNIKNSSSTPLFTYYNSSYDGTSTSTPLTYPLVLANVHLIRVDLVIDVDPNRSPIPRTYTSQVNLRNLKDNL